jgi:hypothetical protein
MTTNIENAKAPGSMSVLINSALIGAFAPLIGAAFGWFFCLAASILSVIKSLIALKPTIAPLADPFTSKAFFAMAALAMVAAIITTLLCSFSAGVDRKTPAPRFVRIIAGAICGALSGFWLVLTRPFNAPLVSWSAGEIALAVLIVGGAGGLIATIGTLVPPSAADKK